MENEIKIVGYVNNLKELDKIFSFQCAYNVKKGDEYNNIWISARTKDKSIKIEENKRYQFTGFIAGDVWEKDGKEMNKPVIVITKAVEVKKDEPLENKVLFYGHTCNIKELKSGVIKGALSFPVKTVTKETKRVYFNFVTKEAIPNKTKIAVEAIFTGDVWEDAETGVKKNKPKLFIKSFKVLEA